ncbi:MAG: VRR-NUC domain-containing protein [Oscillospiraceae bacterium]
MRELFIEEKLTKAVRQNGGVCWKFTSPGTAGVPDRIILMPKGRFAFVEVKAPGEKPRPLQLSRHKLLRRLSFRVYVLDNIDDIEKIISEVMTNEAS